MEVNSDLLDKALDNHQNAILLKLNSKQIATMNKQIVCSIPHISAKASINHLKMLNGYRYVDEISDLKTMLWKLNRRNQTHSL